MNQKTNQLVDQLLPKTSKLVKDPVSYTQGNHDDLVRAVDGLDTFTKNWCMDCEETTRMNEPMFRCNQCEFATEAGYCLIKQFAKKHSIVHAPIGSMVH